MAETAPAPALANVIVLKIQDFIRRPVAEQARLKAQLEALVERAIEPLPAASRIVLDTFDGFAVAAFGGAKDALEIAQRSQAAAADLPLLIGVNHGPVKPASGSVGGAGLVGDGLAAGMTVANFATPGRVLASRSFHEALEASDPGRAAQLSPAGVYTDSQVRAHELYTLDRRAAAPRRWRRVAFGTLAVIGILGAGFASRALRPVVPPPAPPRPAVIALEIAPRGEVYVDGDLMGRSPPLTRLEVRPGRHSIEVRNSPHPPLKLEVDLRPDQEITISHSFTRPKARPRSTEDYVRDQVRDLRRRLGL